MTISTLGQVPCAVVTERSDQVFTAARIADCLDKTPQAIQRHLRGVKPGGMVIVSGKETGAWRCQDLPPQLRDDLTAAARQRRYRDAPAMLSSPPVRWVSPVPLNEIADSEIHHANKLREALLPFLLGQHADNVSSTQLKVLGVEAYAKAFGRSHRIRQRHWWSLFKRTLLRDAGLEEFSRIELYLSDNPKRRERPAELADDTLEEIPGLQAVIGTIQNPAALNRAAREGIWGLVFTRYKALVADGMLPKRAARRVRDGVFARASFLGSRNALLKCFQRNLASWMAKDRKALADGRAENGDRFELPSNDFKQLLHSAAYKNGRRLDAAWREEYDTLSQETRDRYPRTQEAPATIHRQVSREEIETQADRHQGRRKARRRIGGVDRECDIPSMHRWVVDDTTVNLEVVIEREGTISLITPQLVAVMDSASRKWVGWSISDDKAPTAELVCAAVLDGFRRYKVPKNLGVENGFVFGRSVNVNGKLDKEGRTVVAGLAAYGCAIRHFGKMNPTAKAELEKSFDLVQRLMERHPGYTGRLQMLDAPQDFKREQVLIRTGKVEATRFRYTLEEGVRALNEIIRTYNAAPREVLGGLSPDQAFEALKNPNDPPIEFGHDLEWLLANERYRVQVRAGGVRFAHYGRPLRVRGEPLPGLIGKELWALVERRDDPLVTFMNLDFTDPFTMDVCDRPSIDEAGTAPDSGILASELAKVGEHARAINTQYGELLSRFGNPRQDLLLAAQSQPENEQPGRVNFVDPQLRDSAAGMQQQRELIRAEKQEEIRQRNEARKLTRQTGIVVPARAAADDSSEDAKILRDFLEPDQEATR
jgi:hypothetical protein